MRRVELVSVVCADFVFITFAYFASVASAVAIHNIKKVTTQPYISLAGKDDWAVWMDNLFTDFSRCTSTPFGHFHPFSPFFIRWV
jgi:hypothetical protein